jgi:L-alanine-DL-glutamate epimerase-like enolase superfamily enzyme
MTLNLYLIETPRGHNAGQIEQALNALRGDHVGFSPRITHVLDGVAPRDVTLELREMVRAGYRTPHETYMDAHAAREVDSAEWDLHYGVYGKGNDDEVME